MNKYVKSVTEILLLVLVLVISCKHKQENTGPEYSITSAKSGIPIYTFAVHPLFNPEKLMKLYNPLIVYLNNNIKGVKFTIEASRDYKSFEEKFLSKKPDFLLPNPYQTIQAIKVGYKVLATAGESNDFKGLFIVRKDSYIRLPKDLKGKAISYPAPTALAACIMPQYFLYRCGINITTDVQNYYVGSQESSIMNVYLGLTSVGVTWPPPWRLFQKEHPREANELKIIWETEPLINNSVMVRSDIPNEVQEQVKRFLVGLDKSVEGKSILAGIETARFITATNKDYGIVAEYIKQFEKKVRKINMR